MRRLTLALALLFGLASCGAESIWASDEAVQAAKYRHAGPTSITLVTVVNNVNGSGAHAALVVNASQRVIFDPAGTFGHETIPERNDVQYGATERMYATYINYHTRQSFDTYTQEIQVAPEVAEAALRAVENYGAVPKAMCSRSVTEILATLPGFENFPRSWFPNQTRKAFAAYAGVSEKHFVDNDSDDNSYVLKQAF